MADPNPVPASVGNSTISTLAMPVADAVVGVTEPGRTLTVTEVRAELRQGSLRLTPTTTLVSVSPKGSVFARFERVTPGIYTAHAERIDGGGVMQAIADPKSIDVQPPQREVDLLLVMPELTVTVTDTSRPREPVPDAAVHLSGTATLAGTSDASGVTLFKPLPLGNYTVTASHQGFEDGATTATVTTTPSSVALALTSLLDVHVVADEVDAAGGRKTISGAKVDISGPQAASGISDGAGVAQFRGIVAGTYAIKAQHPGYDDGTTAVVVPDKTSVEVKLARIGLDITDAKDEKGLVISERGDQKKIVGQPVDLTVKIHSPGHALSEIQWTIPGEHVKKYPGLNPDKKATREDLTDLDLRGESLHFHWLSGGVKNVMVTAKVDGVPQNATVRFNVLSPTFGGMFSKTADFGVDLSAVIDPDDPPRPGMYLNFGDPNQAGITWDFRAVHPSGGAGLFAGVQLVKVDNSGQPMDGPALDQSTEGRFLLDKRFPYSYATRTSSTGAETAQWLSEDSPGIWIAELKEARLSMDFEIYFMYQPATVGSIWVTIGKLEWHCRASIARIGPGATAIAWSPPTNKDASKNPKGKPSTTLPTWPANMRSVPWK